MSDWIKPEKCDGPIANLDHAWAIDINKIELCIDIHAPPIGPHNQMIIKWEYKSAEDCDHDYQRILKQLGLVKPPVYQPMSLEDR